MLTSAPPIAWGKRALGMAQLTALLVTLLILPGTGVAALDLTLAKRAYATADRVEPASAEPPSVAVYASDDLLGYVFETAAVAPIPAYSGKPVNLLVALDPDGTIAAAEVLSHDEPILLVGIPEQKLQDFAAAHVGAHVLERVKLGAGGEGGVKGVDAISGATVTVMVVNETIMRAARKVAAANGIIDDMADQPRATVRADVFAEADWAALTGDGSIRRLHLTYGEVDAAFAEIAPDAASGKPAEETFIDLYYTYLNAPTVGRNLLGDSQYEWLMSELEPDEHAVAALAYGDYSFKGSGYVRGGIFDRFQLIQGGRTITFHDLDHHRLSDVYAAGMPEFAEMDIFLIRAEADFDPGAPWQAELLVRRATGPLTSEFVSFGGDYQLPEPYLDRPEPIEPEPMWVQVWRDKAFQITVLVAGLIVLTGIMMFQDALARRKRLLRWVRHAFLTYTVVFIGWYALAQLSVVNIFTFVHSVIGGFSWDTFLMDPMMFILWSFVAASLLLWGRGVFCGWLCPFGALQELINELARKLKIKQWELPFAVHERLWAIKYMVLLVLFGISLHSLGAAERYAEIEPFKTAITLRFQREWGFVFYAGALLAISIVNRKFYCRYVCPLGAGLAIPARFRLFDWLKRHRSDCGTPCQICANECEVRAIHPDGRINANECHYCLDCQVTYWDDHKCPPMIKRRKRFEKAAKVATKPAAGKPEVFEMFKDLAKPVPRTPETATTIED